MLLFRFVRSAGMDCDNGVNAIARAVSDVMVKVGDVRSTMRHAEGRVIVWTVGRRSGLPGCRYFKALRFL